MALASLSPTKSAAIPAVSKLAEPAPGFAPGPGSAPPDAPAPAARPRRTRRLLLLAAGAALLGGAALFGYQYWTVGRFLVSTDNAYVGADIALVAPKVSGYVAAVPARANDHVAAGEVLVRLDDSDYRVAVQQAQARIGTQDATIARFGTQMKAAQASIDQTKAQVVAAEADAARAAADFQRTTRLADNKFASQQALDQARADRDKAAANVLAAEAAVASAQANLAVLKAEQTEARRTRDELEAQLAKAQLDLDATVLHAPFAGILGNKAVEIGDYVSAGKRLIALVPDNGAYVDANFKETQIAGLKPGQSAELTLDTDPSHPISGTVESIAPAAGQVFSLLPPENATGNFTKIVQRVAVRIRLDAAARDSARLRPGLSVEATIDTRTGGAVAAADGPRIGALAPPPVR
ncbi:HlyD family secretion protein [Aquabacter spiritensis]|uniref:Membrane fusion protein (Multidrug efflux system) n=1 Tax=Aquabacter spiritensis TaxID=933073 RepID=A0A4R3LYB1_9HYPH|nr:HlyD family secretion protein [Aquabacter spiritensis]TCT05206.1 membrane fusion protein (multidrug efflux system) [Aquabacter spiritensis]